MLRISSTTFSPTLFLISESHTFLCLFQAISLNHSSMRLSSPSSHLFLKYTGLPWAFPSSTNKPDPDRWKNWLSPCNTLLWMSSWLMTNSWKLKIWLHLFRSIPRLFELSLLTITSSKRAYSSSSLTTRSPFRVYQSKGFLFLWNNLLI